MRKGIKVGGIVVMLIASLCACTFGIRDSWISLRTRILNRSEENANSRIQQIVEALNARDKAAVKAVFSPNVQNEAVTIDAGIDYLFDLIPEKIENYERNTESSDTSMEYGKKVEMTRTWYTISTEHNTYAFFLLEYTADTNNPENVGLFALRACKSEDKDTQFTYWQDMQIAGIYVPD